MEHNHQNKLHIFKEKCVAVQDWIMDHTKIVMPLVLVVCVLITVLIAVRANRQEKLEEEAQIAAAAVAEQEGSSAAVSSLISPEFELEMNSYPEVNSVVRRYYDAQAEGDIDAVSSLNSYLDDIAKIRVGEMSKYIESYPVVDVYTKPGLVADAYVAYVYAEVKFQDVDQVFPGIQTYYIGMDESGNYFINDGTYDAAVWEYIKAITLQDDVVDLFNRVTVKYNELLENDTELNEYIAYLREKVSEEVGEILAEAEQPEAEEETQVADTGKTDEQEAPSMEPIATVVRTVRATDVVNIRTSDSETADKIDKAQIGQEFTLLEQRGNGWSKVEFNGRDAYIKSDYLEIVEEVVVANNTSAENTTSNTGDTTSQSSSQEVIGTVKVVKNVKIRKGASITSEALATAYVGDTLDVIMKQADGWTKIKYQGEIAYVKSDYVE